MKATGASQLRALPAGHSMSQAQVSSYLVFGMLKAEPSRPRQNQKLGLRKFVHPCAISANTNISNYLIHLNSTITDQVQLQEDEVT